MHNQMALSILSSFMPWITRLHSTNVINSYVLNMYLIKSTTLTTFHHLCLCFTSSKSESSQNEAAKRIWSPSQYPLVPLSTIWYLGPPINCRFFTSATRPTPIRRILIPLNDFFLKKKWKIFLFLFVCFLPDSGNLFSLLLEKVMAQTNILFKIK